MTENCKLRKAILFRILQHFSTKLWNITNFVMLFQAVLKFLLRSKFSLLRKWSIELLQLFATIYMKVHGCIANGCNMRRPFSLIYLTIWSCKKILHSNTSSLLAVNASRRSQLNVTYVCLMPMLRLAKSTLRWRIVMHKLQYCSN
jgi:hypothetical protein